MSEIFETHFARYPVHRRCFVRFLASTASAAFILKDTNKELGGYVRVGATYNITESKGANCHFTSDISQRKYYGEHIFNSDNVCSYCGHEAKKIAGHTHTWKLTSNSWLHWYVCENPDCGATKDPEIHNFGSDNKCKICGLTHHHNSWETLISLDFTSHWYACSRCNARKENTLHSSPAPGKCGAPSPRELSA